MNLGGVDSADIVGMSGGWTRTFTLASPQPVTLSFRYNLSQTPEYEPGEISEALLMVDGTLLSIGGTQALAQLEGDGTGGATLTTDWVVVTHDLGTLAAGTHTLTLGAFNNQKTFTDESTTLLIDEVSLTALTAGFPLTVSLSGNGTVTSSPGGITCPSGACTANFATDTSVTLTATPDSGASFNQWSGACSGSSSSCIVPITFARNVAATFTTTTSPPPPPPGATLPFTANFTSGADGFVYTDDAFRGTSQPSYASGTHLASGGFSGGGLQVNLGGVDSADIVGISGGWTRTFTLASPQPVTLSFRYNLSQTPEYEPGEISEALLMVDGTLLSIGGTQALAQLEGDGPGGATLTTDWVVVTHDLGTLAAGTHTLTLGAFNNQKTQAEEATTLLIDEVSITGQATTFPLTVTVSGNGSVTSSPAGITCPGAACTMNVPEDTAVTLTATPGSGASFSQWGGACSGSGSCVVSMTTARSVTATFGGNPPPPPGATLPFTANFTSGADGFVYTDDVFRGTSQPSYASGTHLASGGFSGGGLQVNLGGVDSADIVGMSGGWTRTFTLASPQPVTLSFRYNLSQTPEYEPGEISEALLMVDGTLLSIGGTQALAQLEGDGTGGATLTTDWVVVTHDLGTLAAGTHTLTLGAFNNQKTFTDESTTLLIDEVSLTALTAGFPLTVSLSGNGTVTSSPGGITCPSGACTANFATDTSVTLTATPDSGASFSQWSGACSGSSSSCIVPITFARNVAATFTTTTSPPPPPPGATLPFTANFTSGADGFVYTDDVFRGTSQPSYASGTHLASGGFSGGGLQVNLGGVDSADIVGMSGGWTRTFTLASPQPVTLSFRYNLSQTPEYEPGEISEALLMVDGTLLSIGGTQALAQLEGDGTGGATLTTDWVVVTHDLGTLAAGTHTLTLGAFNNQKTFTDESTTLLIDEVSLTALTAGFPLTVSLSGNGTVTSSPGGITCPSGACTANFATDTSVTLTATPDSGASFSQWSGACSGSSSSCIVPITFARNVAATFTTTTSPPPPPPGATLPFTANFTSGADGFVYTDDAFRGTSQPSYASGTHLASGGFSGGGLQVNLGGVDSADIVGMSGGWTRTFTLASPQPVTLSFRYNLSQTPEYEPGEISEALLMVDGTLLSIGGTQALAQLEGDGTGGATLTTDWVVVTHDLGTLAAGTHTLTLGAFNNQKTFTDESTTLLIDEVSITGQATTLLSEDFADGDLVGWTVIDQGTVNTPSAWSATGGALQQTSNINNGTNSGLPLLGTHLRYNNGFAWTNYHLALTLRSEDNDALGILVRYQDLNNYYRFSWDRERSHRRLVKVHNGVFTLLDDDTVPHVQGQSYQVEFQVEGTQLTVRVDGAIIFNVTDSSLPAGTVALYSWANTGAHFDDVIVSQ